MGQCSHENFQGIGSWAPPQLTEALPIIENPTPDAENLLPGRAVLKRELGVDCEDITSFLSCHNGHQPDSWSNCNLRTTAPVIPIYNGSDNIFQTRRSRPDAERRRRASSPRRNFADAAMLGNHQPGNSRHELEAQARPQHRVKLIILAVVSPFFIYFSFSFKSFGRVGGGSLAAWGLGNHSAL
ncbi:hypothetical protein QBC44DRAFT_312902 [Cladorrhinum sp. PSN332]|nr:hypothetical protein QBC44DRAFT_312902 [Cladorrhinum sp. PSN332]